MKKFFLIQLPEPMARLAESEAKTIGKSLDDYFSSVLETHYRVTYKIQPAKELLTNE